jgi:hypothetical protein
MWKEMIEAYFKVLSQKIPGWTEENDETWVKIASLQTEIRLEFTYHRVRPTS